MSELRDDSAHLVDGDDTASILANAPMDVSRMLSAASSHVNGAQRTIRRIENNTDLDYRNEDDLKWYIDAAIAKLQAARDELDDHS